MWDYLNFEHDEKYGYFKKPFPKHLQDAMSKWLRTQDNGVIAFIFIYKNKETGEFEGTHKWAAFDAGVPPETVHQGLKDRSSMITEEYSDEMKRYKNGDA